jgi:hypothetical protein
MASLPGTILAQACGVTAVLFRDGVEADAQPAPLALADNTALALSLDAGQDGGTVWGASVDIVGGFDGPTTTGIAAAGRRGYRAGRRWLIRDVPLQPGVNNIEVVATTLTGATLARRLSIARDDTQAPLVQLLVDTPPKHAPAGVQLRLSLRQGAQATRLRVDYDGDGTFELDTIDLDQPLRHVYQQPGAYRALARVDYADPPANTVDARAHVLVRHVGETRAALCAAFEHMRARLVARDVPGALLALQPRMHDAYRAMWQGLGTNLPGAARALGFIADGVLGNEFAELTIARPIPGQAGQLQGFPVQLDLGADGVWRIGSM